MSNWPPSELLDFIGKCREINEKRGEVKHAPICGWVGREPRFFSDEEIEIACATDSEEMEIRILPPLHPDRLSNPVIMITESGELLRAHGEWVYARVKVDRLAREIRSCE